MPTRRAAGQGTSNCIRPRPCRIAAGDSYYAAVEGELRERGYPMQSVFNWRTPLPVWLIAVLPQGWAQVLLVALAGAMWLLGLGLLGREFGRLGILAGMATISGAVLPCLLDEVFIMPEVWAGVLIGLSAAAYGTERNRLGCAAALAALLGPRAGGPVVPGLFAVGRASAWTPGRRGVGRRFCHLRRAVRPAFGTGATANRAERHRSRARLGPFRRSRFLDLDRADEHLAAVGPAVAGRFVSGRRAAGSGRLVEPGGQADRLGRGALRRGVFDRGPGDQSILGFADRAAACPFGRGRPGRCCAAVAIGKSWTRCRCRAANGGRRLTNVSAQKLLRVGPARRLVLMERLRRVAVLVSRETRPHSPNPIYPPVGSRLGSVESALVADRRAGSYNNGRRHETGRLRRKQDTNSRCRPQMESRKLETEDSESKAPAAREAIDLACRIISVTSSLFKAEATFCESCDPEFPSDRYHVVAVETSLSPAEIVRAEQQWIAEIIAIAPEWESLRLSIRAK